LTLVGPEVPLGAGAGIGVRESDTQLKGELNQAIDAMKEDGSLNALIKKWFGDDAPTF
jgi:polar amino acid transport system substrate-binding protein